MVKVGISGCHFLPWLGYFDKMKKSDILIIFDNVQRTSRGYSNRVQIKTPDGAFWLSVPRVHAGFQQMYDVKIAKKGRSADYLYKTIQRCYSRAPHFKIYYPSIYSILQNDWEFLIDLNMALINHFYGILNIQTKLVLASDLNIPKDLRATDRLIALVKAVDGDLYVCGAGARAYQEDEKIRQNGLELLYQNFKHPKYPQLFGEFIPGLSIIDALFNIGKDAVIEKLEVSSEEWISDRDRQTK